MFTYAFEITIDHRFMASLEGKTMVSMAQIQVYRKRTIVTYKVIKRVDPSFMTYAAILRRSEIFNFA